MDVRPALRSEIDAIARLWHDSWQEAHSEILPEGHAQFWTLATFEKVLCSDITKVHVVGPIGKPLGLSIVKDDELNQIHVNKESRGTGVAKALIDDAERRISRAGNRIAWLACGIGNSRAARFYEKCGWHLASVFTHELKTPAGSFQLDVWRFEKQLLSDEQGPS
ncbi:MAG TPA: GNAT family N-acetyltransferase [Pyrinomonadaceae bacterium]|nr:GNAT family N-acetyltransferase [Chloracidobacterium sp.]HBE83816.1 GNAT family N-acetyltransferase [Blastocatellia bacterium]HRJ89968.1 GNAT family N-acetyltransferase [Pyrinomonadaceae bacterium]HRK49624.1 GNAT family N-acetyltransferase [Pyrinomonadaceae bacterium]